MKATVTSILLIVAGGAASAQTNDLDLNGMLDSAQQFAQENLDPDVLQVLQSLDRDKVQDFFKINRAMTPEAAA